MLEVSVLERSLFRDVDFRCWHGVVNKPNEVDRGFVVKCGFGTCEWQPVRLWRSGWLRRRA